MEFFIRGEFESATFRKDWFTLGVPYCEKLSELFLDKEYGKDVETVLIVFRVYTDYSDRKDVKKYSKKNKIIVLGAHVNADEYIEANEKQLIYLIKAGIMDAVASFNELRTKPKNFSFPLFYANLSRIIG
jgi:hypothetical protein